MMIDANMNRCKLRLIIPLWACLIQICQPIVLALVLLLNAVFVYFTNLETFFQTFKIKNGTIEPGLKAHYTRKMKNPVTILRQENVEEVLCDRFS